MNVLIVIQARLGSTRLPSKVLLPLGPDNKPVLQHVVERAQRSGYPVVVAVPASHLQPELRACGAIYRCPGDENDVLGRYAYLAASPLAASIIVRLTADCPLLNPALIERAVQAIREGHDYASNTLQRTYPRGWDVEAFHVKLLQDAHREATDPYDREHVTPWMQRWASNPYPILKTAQEPLGLSERHRWTLDTPADYRWVLEAYRRFPDPSGEQLLTLPPRWD